MKRRDFLKVSGAVIVASQLPNIGEVKAASKEYPFARYSFESINPAEHVVYTTPIRRRVIFYSQRNVDLFRQGVRWTPPPPGTLVGSDEYLCGFTIIDQAHTLPALAYVTSAWDEHEHGIPAGKVYEGIVMTVEAVGHPVNVHRTCNIRHVVSPQGDSPYSVCEAWRSEYLGDWQAQSYVVDALYPPDPADMKRECRML